MAENDANHMLSGNVEFDDTYFGAASEGGKSGRGTAKTSILVAYFSQHMEQYGWGETTKCTLEYNKTGQSVRA